MSLSLNRRIWMLAWPLLLSNLTAPLLGLVDTAVVGGGCCGLAGNWGFEPGHHEISQTLGERNLFPAIRAAGPGSIVLADGFSCRTQIAQGTDAEGVHLAQVMYAALRAEK